MIEKLSKALSELTHIKKDLEAFALDPEQLDLYDSICSRIDAAREYIETVFVKSTTGE